MRFARADVPDLTPLTMSSSHHRLDREAEFHDQAFTEDTRASAGKFYSITGASQQLYYALISKNAASNHALEYGCGRGGYCFELARQGSFVDAIDISPAGVEIAAQKAQEDDLGERLRFQIMDAEDMTFPDEHFDIIFGHSILHHLDLNRAVREVARVLKDGGRAVFFEPLGHNVLINAYRRLTPRMRSEDERPLRIDDLTSFSEFFSEIKIHHFHLLTLLAIPFRKIPGLFGALVSFLDGIDRLLFRLLPFLRKQAWIIVVELSGPQSPDTNSVKAIPRAT